MIGEEAFNAPNRDAMVDILKGLAISLVLFGHCRSELNYLSRLCVGCHMPAFFFASGLVLSTRRSIAGFTLSKLRTLAWPFLTASLLYWIALPDSRESIVRDTLAFTGSGPLWFLPTLGIALLVARMTIGASGRVWSRVGLLLLWLATCLLPSSLAPVIRESPGLVVLVRSAIAFGFVYLGWMGRDVIREWSLLRFLPAAVAYFLLAELLRTRFVFDLRCAIVPDAAVYLSLALCGIAALVLASRIVSRHETGLKRGLVWLGRNSLCLMITHWVTLFYMKPIAQERISGHLLQQLVCFGFVFPWSLGATILVDRYIPWFVRFGGRAA